MALPSDEERRALCDMAAAAFVEIRMLTSVRQAAALADAFHNLPREIYGWGTWDPNEFRGRLVAYQNEFHANDYWGKTDYVRMLDAIFPPARH